MTRDRLSQEHESYSTASDILRKNLVSDLRSAEERRLKITGLVRRRKESMIDISQNRQMYATGEIGMAQPKRGIRP